MHPTSIFRLPRTGIATTRWFLATILAFVPCLSANAQSSSPAKRPNIVFILTDDQGYGDLSCHGNPILKTPNLDALHARSVRFRDYHVSPTCAPTRAALFTGRHEFRSGVTHTINERERLRLQAFTLAQLLKQAGYLTGIFGKWHLGDEADHQPDRRGFDEVFIHGGGGIGQTYPGSCGDAPGNRYFDPAILHNGRFEKTKGYCTDLFFDEALRWIDAERKESSPFFCWIATNAPHLPLQVPANYEAMYTGKVTADEAKFFGMIANIDDNVGKLVARLKEWNLEENTIVVFMTDNGGTVGTRIFNAGMRGMKVTPYLGGTRVPFFVAWPGHLPAGVDVDALTAHIDIFPTFAELTDAQDPGESEARRPKPGAAAARQDCRLARPDAVHARRSLGQGEGRRIEVRPLLRADLAVPPGAGEQERRRLAIVRRQDRLRRADGSRGEATGGGARPARPPGPLVGRDPAGPGERGRRRAAVQSVSCAVLEAIRRRAEGCAVELRAWR